MTKPEHSPVVDLREIAVRKIDGRFGYSYEFSADPDGHRALYDIEVERLIERCEWVTPSGRRWRARPSRWSDEYTMFPLGDDTYSGGGVRAVRVKSERLDGFDRVWRPIYRGETSR